MMYSDLTGQQLGDYRLLSLVGHGSFASVYLGQNVYIEGLKVAVKVIHAPLSDKVRSDFYKEAQVLTLLKHPHIVPILGFGVTQNTPYIITEYAPNGTLYEYMSKTPGAPEEIAPVIKQIAEGLYAAHQKKFVHRDIKPRNILFGADNQILISDFGLAVVAWDSLRSSLHKSLQVHFSGTPLYMAPEQWKSKPVPASDQYSLAVIVYQWLCGETPFRGNILPQLMFQHERQLPAPLCEKVPHLPREIDRVVLKALEKEPRQRFATVLEFAEAFSKACPQPVSLGKTALMSPQTPSSPAPPTQLPYPNPPSAAPAAQRAVASVPSVPSSTGSGSSLRSISRRGMLVGLGLSLGAAATYLTIKALTPVKGAGSTSPTPIGIKLRR